MSAQATTQSPRAAGSIGAPLTIYWLRHVLLYTASWQRVAEPGTSWRYRLMMRPDADMVARPTFVPEEIERISLYG